MLGISYTQITEHRTYGIGSFILMLNTRGEVLSTRESKDDVEKLEGERVDRNKVNTVVIYVILKKKFDLDNMIWENWRYQGLKKCPLKKTFSLLAKK